MIEAIGYKDGLKYIPVILNWDSFSYISVNVFLIDMAVNFKIYLMWIISLHR